MECTVVVSAAVVRSKFSTILLAIAAQAQNTLNVTSNQVLIGMGDDDPPYDAQPDTYMILKPGPFTLDQKKAASNGRVLANVNQRLMIDVFNRNNLDEPDRATSALTDSTLGFLDKLAEVYNALHIFPPSDAVADWINEQPMRLIGGTALERIKDKPGWSKCRTEWDVYYCLALNQSMQ
jgi:hypothetical protein